MTRLSRPLICRLNFQLNCNLQSSFPQGSQIKAGEISGRIRQPPCGKEHVAVKQNHKENIQGYKNNIFNLFAQEKYGPNVLNPVKSPIHDLLGIQHMFTSSTPTFSDSDSSDNPNFKKKRIKR